MSEPKIGGMNYRKKISEFYTSYLLWVANGAPHDDPYARNWGLCSNLQSFCHDNNIKDTDAQKLQETQRDMFTENNLNIAHPFNLTLQLYNISSFSWTQHENLQRLDWCRAHV